MSKSDFLIGVKLEKKEISLSGEFLDDFLKKYKKHSDNNDDKSSIMLPFLVGFVAGIIENKNKASIAANHVMNNTYHLFV